MTTTQPPTTDFTVLNRQADDPTSGFRRWRSPCGKITLIIHRMDAEQIVVGPHWMDALLAQRYIIDQLWGIHPAWWEAAAARCFQLTQCETPYTVAAHRVLYYACRQVHADNQSKLGMTPPDDAERTEDQPDPSLPG